MQGVHIGLLAWMPEAMTPLKARARRSIILVMEVWIDGDIS